MEFIDKQRGKEWAHEIIDDFLRRCRQYEQPFPTDLYKALKNDRKDGVNTFQQYSESILKENDCHCCYCMRTIKKHPLSHKYPMTLEHVILNSIVKQSDYDAYYCTPSELEKGDMTLTANFMESQQYPPYPHTIAYENLIPSCLGNFPRTGSSSKTCNNYRGNKFLPPLVFRRTIKDEIRYYTDGTVEWTKDSRYNKDEIPYVNILGLNYIDLRFIRCVWYYLTKERLDYNIPEDRERVLRIIEAELNDEDKDSRELLESLRKFNDDAYWKLLGDFLYFNQMDLFYTRKKQGGLFL